MSEDRNLNPGGSSPDVDRILQSLVPEPLDVARDELFFQAGYAAGARGRTTRFVWPLAAAALLVICAGLGIALLRQADELQTALAERTDSNAVASGDSAAKPQAAAVFERSDRFLANEQSWRLRGLLSSSGYSRPGQLTAMGWVDKPEAESNPTRDTLTEPPAPRRPSSYLELLRSYQEG